MAGNKLSPRQKMIGMMYLVLTALLALNISKEILNAFLTVNEGLEETKHNFREKNEAQYTAFEASYRENETKVKPYYDKAIQIRKKADEVVDYIDNIKVAIISRVEGLDSSLLRGDDGTGKDTIYNLRNVQVKDDYIQSTNLLVGSDPDQPREGTYSARSMRNQLEEFRDLTQSMVSKEEAPALYHALGESFHYKDVEHEGKTEKWEAHMFYSVPVAATITLLSKLQTDVRNAESDAVKYLYSSVDAASFKFNKLDAMVIPASNYVLQGDTFKARVLLAAYDTTKSPEMILGEKYDSASRSVTGDTIGMKVKDGLGYINIPTNAQGDFTWEGVINFEAPGGKVLPYPFKTMYQVAKPSTTVSATAMNVFYIGVPNPVSISAPGVPKEAVRASISGGGGTIKKTSDGNWEVNVKQTGKAKIVVNAEVEGANKKMGEMEFRVKRIPSPVAKIGGKSSGAIRKAQLKATQGIQADMGDFLFDIRVPVVSYTFSYVQRNGLLTNADESGNRFTAKIKTMIGKVRTNQNAIFENIKVRMPDGSVRTIPPVVLKVI